MHLLVVIQEDFPNSDAINKFIEFISRKQYNATHVHPSWNRIRAREIRLFDFTIPEKAEKEVIADLLTYEGHGLAKLNKLLDNPFIARIAKRLGVEPIDRGNLTATSSRKFPVRLAIIGKYRDCYDEKNRELL